ncbi:hypothetical protein H6F89_11350 [Cyanobacteria bacterium FACHB-63]|nr:hypothetical protein [Cyanobacteria bacterium FACHB-63]
MTNLAIPVQEPAKPRLEIKAPTNSLAFLIYQDQSEAAQEAFRKHNEKRKSEPKKEPKGYIRKFVPGSKLVLDIIDRISTEKKLSKEARRLYCHLLHCSNLLEVDAEEYVVISADLVNKVLGSPAHNELIESGLVDFTAEKPLDGKCRTYKILDQHADEIYQAQYQSLLEDDLDPIYNLVTGKQAKYRPSQRYNTSRNEIPDLLLRSYDNITICAFNKRQVKRHFAETYPEMPKRGSKEARTLQVDKYCFDMTRAQECRRLSGDIWCYRPSFEPQSTGRITERGGFQSCTTEMKQAAFYGIRDVFNFDMRSSQPNLLIILLERAGLDSSWLREYISNKDNKFIYAERAGLLVGAWKKCLLAAIMGSPFPTKKQRNNPGNGYSSIADYVWEAVAADKDAKYLVTLGKLQKVLQPLLKVMAQWHKLLIEDAKQNPFQVGKEYFVRNEAGCVFPLKDYLNEQGELINKEELKRRLAAFHLQGMEALIVHTLTGLAEEFGFRVLSNQHDGLVVLGRIPDAAVQRTLEITGIPTERVAFDKKDLCDELPDWLRNETDTDTDIEAALKALFNAENPGNPGGLKPSQPTGEGTGEEQGRKAQERRNKEGEPRENNRKNAQGTTAQHPPSISTSYIMATPPATTGLEPDSFFRSGSGPASGDSADVLLKVEAFVGGRGYVSVQDVAAELGLSERKAGSALKQLGWERGRKRINSKHVWFYFAPQPTTEQAPEPQPAASKPKAKSKAQPKPAPAPELAEPESKSTGLGNDGGAFRRLIEQAMAMNDSQSDRASA